MAAASPTGSSAMAMRRLNRLVSHLGVGARAVGAASAAKAGSSSAGLPPIKVCVTGAAGNIGYALLFFIAQGRMLGADQPVELRLLDIPPAEGKLKGVEMELRDGAFPLVSRIVATTDYRTAFTGAEVCLLVGARPRGPGMDRADLLNANAAIFKGQGKAIDQFAHRNVKVVVVGNPANTNALITMENAPGIPRENFTALTRLDDSRALGLLSERTGVPVAQLSNVIIWGNHSKTQYPDVRYAVVRDFPERGQTTPLRTLVNDDDWLRGAFAKRVQFRGAEVIGARGSSSAASAANAVVDHVRTWLLGTAPGQWKSMAVCSDNNPYGVPDGLIFSFPVTCSKGTWKIVPGLKIDAHSRSKLDITTAELVGEKKTALSK